MKTLQVILLSILFLVGIFIRFYQLNWGAPFYFHPDERNIASAVTGLSFPKQFNPHFFAYGSLPIYLIYFFGLLLSLVSHTHSFPSISFETAIISSRILTAIFSVVSIYFVYRLGKRLKDMYVGILAATLMTFSTGLVQFAHFGTVESWLTFFSILFFLCLVSLIEKLSWKTVSLSGIAGGILVAIKISSLVLLPLIPLVVFFALTKATKLVKIIVIKLFAILFSLVTAAAVYVFTNPFTILDSSSFINSMHYESGVSLGTEKVFYTGEFFKTTPIVFQFLHIYPFIANPVLTILFIPSCLILFFLACRKKNPTYMLLFVFYLVLFLSQAFLFTKWTRYIIPTLPFFYLIIALAIAHLFKKENERRISMVILSVVSMLFCIAYIFTAYGQKDTRLAAYEFAKKHIPNSAEIMSEPYDLGILPFNNTYPHITLFPFYDIDTSLSFQKPNAAYIILPSQRLYKIRLLNPAQFPHGHQVYSDLFSGKAGYTKLYETPCPLLCKIAYSGNPVFSLEETATVFDRPNVYIFKKQ